jgi:tRNA U34 5-methylaminomethyl-2-thiouridine-forming methyltransferase MnmC
MYELYPYFTNDGSVGLFSPDADDIYHSTYGALTEAYEKFILPANFDKFFEKNSEIKILDICFGIGYNTKSFLNFFYNYAIGANNIKHIDKLDTNNKKSKIYIHAIDMDKNLAQLSPFFITDKKNRKTNKLSFEQEKIQRMLSGKISANFKLNKEIDIILLKKIFPLIDNETETILFSPKYDEYFDKYMRSLFQFYKSQTCKLSPIGRLNTFLHNIYYKYISTCHKNATKALRLLDFDFKLNISDARSAIKNDNTKYNYIFLDAFTPVKCPCLWTVDFFKLLFEHLEDDGMILTYSNSALVRNAFLHAGFSVGKIFSESANKFTGTIATKNPDLIKYDLSEYDLGLMKTKAGIFYNDKNLRLPNEAIISAHKNEVETSNLMSSSKFIKEYRRNHEI